MTPDSLMTIGRERLQLEAQRRILSKVNLQPDGLKQFNKMTAIGQQVKSTMTDSAAIRQVAKEKAEGLAMKYIDDNPQVLQAAQKKVGMLMSKYSFIRSGNDLTGAVRKTSLTGRSFKERLFVATNFQIHNLKPVSVDFSPQIGYRLNSLFTVGTGFTYRKTFADSMAVASADAIGGKAFIIHDLVKSFFCLRRVWPQLARNEVI